MAAVEVYDGYHHYHLPSKFRQSKSDNDLHSKLPTKNQKTSSKSESESSFGAPGVPFRWESCPGTPKHPFDEEIVLPPLTPPPSYLFPGKIQTTSGDHKKHKKHGFFQSIFPRIVCLKPVREPAKSLESSSVASSSVSSSNSMTSTPRDHFGSRGKGFGVLGSGVCSKVDGKTSEMAAAAAAMSVVSGEKGGGGGKSRRRYQPMKNVKKALSFLAAGGKV